MENNLAKAKLAFIGCGVMAESIIAGLLKKGLVAAQQIAASHPREARRSHLSEKYKIEVFEDNRQAVENCRENENSIVVLCVKPQRIKGVLRELKGVVAADQLILSIVAGARI